MTKRPFLGVALGGGGVRGAAHIGVLQGLADDGIEIDIISGVSAGSVIATMYAFSKDPFWIEQQLRKLWDDSNSIPSDYFYRKNDLSSFSSKIKKSILDHVFALLSLHRNSIVDKKPLEKIIRTLVPVSNFNELQIPLKIVATDLENGEDIIYENGDLVDALIQSCSIPGIISPTFMKNKIIVDGGAGMPIPITILKEVCDFTIAVDIGLYKLQRMKNVNAKTIYKRANVITSNRLKKLLSMEADFIIQPDTLGKEWSDFGYAEDLFKQGKIATKNVITELKKKIHEKKQIHQRI